MAHTSLLANGVWSASCLAQAQFANADFSTMPAQRMTSALYQTKDGRWMQLSMVRTIEGIDRMLLAMEASQRTPFTMVDVAFRCVVVVRRLRGGDVRLRFVLARHGWMRPRSSA